MRNIKMKIQYEGTRYNGWQRQGNTENTIQGKLEKLLSKMTEEVIELAGSGRTDAGVHAKGQIVNFHTKTKMSVKEMENYIQQYLPKDIAIIEITEAAPKFHSRLNAVRKMYEYQIYTGKENPVFERNYVWHLGQKLDLDAMRKAAAYFVGEHDFRSFCGNKKMKKSCVRRIEQISIEESISKVTIQYIGNGFLMNMVRILTGTLVEVGMGLRKAESMIEILEAKNREMAGKTAPSTGLCLMEVWY